MLDVRVYRAAFLPALIAVFVAAFSLADRPAPTTTGLSAEAFDAASAFGDAAKPRRNSLNELARTFPSRAAGSDDPVERVLELLHDVPAGKLAIADLGELDDETLEALERAGIDAVIVAGDRVGALAARP